MDFGFNEEQDLFRNNLRQNVEKEVLPGYMERANREEADQVVIHKTIQKMGLMGFGVPEEYGGQGVEVDALTAGIIAEELGRVDVAWAQTWLGNYIQTNLLNKIGPERLKKEYLPGFCSGDLLMANLYTEPHGGTDLADVRTIGIKDGDHYIINGQKCSISRAFCDAYFAIANIDPDTPGAEKKGISFVFIPAELPGIEKSVYRDAGLKQLGRGDVFLKDVRIPADCLLTEPGKGFQEVMHIFDLARPCLATMCIGCAERVIENTIEYTKQRMSFGKPLCKYEAISFGLSEHATFLAAAKLMAYKALWIRSNDGWNAKEAAMAKWFGIESAFNAIWFCTRAYGHLGYTSEYDAVNRLLDVMGYAWGDGGWEAQKMVIAREIGGREFLPYDRPKKK